MFSKLINFIVLFVVCQGAVGYVGPKDTQSKRQYAKIVAEFGRYGIQNTAYLAYRDVPMLMAEYLTAGLNDKYTALDFGCGTGTSTRLIKRISKNARVYGVDSDNEMLTMARSIDKHGHYVHLKNHKLPYKPNSFDFVFSSFAFLDMSSKDQMQQVISEIRRVLKPDGLFILVTGSEEMFNPENEWLSLDNNYEQNLNLTSGTQGRIHLKDTSVTFFDYYWTENDYEELFRRGGLRLHYAHKPLGNDSDQVAWTWKKEQDVSPFIMYVLRKS